MELKQEDIDTFVYHYLYKQVRNDLFNIWVFNLVYKVVSATDGDEIDILIDSQFGTLIPVSLEKAILGLYQDCQDITDDKRSFQQFINTPYFNQRTLLDLIFNITQNTRVYDLFQYKNKELLLELPFLLMLHKLLYLNKYKIGSRPIEIDLYKIVDKFKSNKGYKKFNDYKLNSFIETSMWEFNY